MKAWFRLDIKPTSGSIFYDVTDNVMVSSHIGITLEEHASLLDKLTFTLRSTDSVSVNRYIDSLTEGAEVRFWFGYGEGYRRYNQEQEMFYGFIGRLRAQYPRSGYPQLEVTALDAGWLLTQNKPATQKTYPGVVGEKWSYKQLVEKVMSRYSSQIGVGKIKIPDSYSNITFDEKHSAVQKSDETDWKFLKRIAFDEYDEVSLYSGKDQREVNLGCECLAYFKMEGGKPQLYFVPESDAMKDVSKIRFFYPMHRTNIPTEQDFTSDDTVIIAENITVDDNPDTASEIVVHVPADAFSDVLTPEQIKIVNADGGFTCDQETYIESFEVDHNLIQRDESAGAIKWGVMDYQAGKVGWEQVKKYVKLKVVYVPAGEKNMKSDVPISDDDLKDPVKRQDTLAKVVGKRKKKRRTAGFTMSIDLMAGNYNIRPRKCYPVLNIGGKYSTDSSTKVKWFCESVTHKVGDTYSQTIKLTM